ncbi:hypothetical protein CEXT_621891 [Caerostris extrusa]|uniref:Uncharacterized protein n=1 Tax=Caerostris extrusa TaxID=172846 RepID=A0AAV4N7I8_CAEEX|nr:hypothetical protein CEXT_621891 [Caerostris extrusa]
MRCAVKRKDVIYALPKSEEINRLSSNIRCCRLIVKVSAPIYLPLSSELPNCCRGKWIVHSETLCCDRIKRAERKRVTSCR